MPELTKHPDDSLQKKMVEELRHFLDIPVNISIQLRARIMQVRDILELQPGSVIELPIPACESVDILINGYRIASGEIIPLEGARSIRLTGFRMLE